MDDVFETTMHQPDGPVGNHPMQGVRVDEGTHAWMILEIAMPWDKIRGCSERLERVPKLPVNEKKNARDGVVLGNNYSGGRQAAPKGAIKIERPMMPCMGFEFEGVGKGCGTYRLRGDPRLRVAWLEPRW